MIYLIYACSVKDNVDVYTYTVKIKVNACYNKMHLSLWMHGCSFVFFIYSGQCLYPFPFILENLYICFLLFQTMSTYFSCYSGQ